MVDKLGFCYGILARFGVPIPTLPELEERAGLPPQVDHVPLAGAGEEQPIVAVPEEGIGGGIAEVNPGVEALPPAAMLPQIIGGPFAPPMVPDQQEPVAIPADEVRKILGIGGPVIGRIRGPNDARPDMEVGQPQAGMPAMMFINILCRCGGMSVANAVAAVSNAIQFNLPIPLPTPEDQAKKKNKDAGIPDTPEAGWEPPAFPEEGEPYQTEKPENLAL